MSQINADHDENFLTLVRVSVGGSSPVLWDQNESPSSWVHRNVSVLSLELPQTENSPQDQVNPLRLQAINQSHTKWVWLVDADVIPDARFYLKLKEHLERNSQTKLLGGLYKSHTNQSLWERSYNRLCNLWSRAHQSPLAGNMIIHRDLAAKIQNLKDVPFGREEHFIRAAADHAQAETAILPLSLVHSNQKNLKKLWKTCRQQARPDSPPVPKAQYAKLIASEFPKAPLEVSVCVFYLLLSLIFSSLGPRKESH